MSDNNKNKAKWVIPYIDQPPAFWKEILSDYGDYIQSVYFPLPGNLVGSGRPLQPDRHLAAFLQTVDTGKSLAVNPLVLPEKIENIGARLIKAIGKMIRTGGISEVILANAALAEMIRKAFPEIILTASTLMDIHTPFQLNMAEGLFDTIVVPGRILRNMEALIRVRSGFRGKIRLLVNEACLPGCIFRTQHFYEMGSPGISHPESLCQDLLERKPWMRLTGAWILPQFLDLYDGLYDELKLAGRVTLQDPHKYRFVLSGYLERKILMPHETGGGPASPLDPVHIDREFFKHTLYCDHNCNECSTCEDYWDNNSFRVPDDKPVSAAEKSAVQTKKPEQLLRESEKEFPPGTDTKKILEGWMKLLPLYHTLEKTMPSPEWKDNEPEDTGAACWKAVREKIRMPCRDPFSVYVHVPFCDRKCSFCDCFSERASKRSGEKMEHFTRLLLSEIRLWSSRSNLPEREVTTIHFGGGTPNHLPAGNLRNIVNCLKQELKVIANTELALESTASLLTKEHLTELQETGFTRLHVGIQTLDDPLRKLLGRKETAGIVLDKLTTALQMGFIVSVDIIYGLPFQGIDSLMRTLTLLTDAGIHGFSLYHLNITDRNRRFFDKLKNFERDISRDWLLFMIADQYLVRKGYTKNHFVHYARTEDKNLYYNHVRRGEDLLALGPTADGIFGDYYYIHQWISAYLALDKMDFPPLHGGGRLTERDIRLRPLKAQLLSAGIRESTVREYGFSNLTDRWLENGLVQKSVGGFTLTGNGSWFINRMAAELMAYGI